MLYIIGLGLSDQNDISVKGLSIVRSCDKIYLEYYTSVLLNFDLTQLERLYGKKVVLIDRNTVESGLDHILMESLELSISFLVVGDPFGYFKYIF